MTSGVKTLTTQPMLLKPTNTEEVYTYCYSTTKRIRSNKKVTVLWIVFVVLLTVNRRGCREKPSFNFRRVKPRFTARHGGRSSFVMEVGGENPEEERQIRTRSLQSGLQAATLIHTKPPCPSHWSLSCFRTRLTADGRNRWIKIYTYSRQSPLLYRRKCVMPGVDGCFCSA